MTVKDLLNTAEYSFDEVRLYDLKGELVTKMEEDTLRRSYANYTVRTFWIFVDYHSEFTVLELTLNGKLDR